MSLQSCEADSLFTATLIFCVCTNSSSNTSLGFWFVGIFFFLGGGGLRDENHYSRFKILEKINAEIFAYISSNHFIKDKF